MNSDGLMDFIIKSISSGEVWASVRGHYHDSLTSAAALASVQNRSFTWRHLQWCARYPPPATAYAIATCSVFTAHLNTYLKYTYLTFTFTPVCLDL